LNETEEPFWLQPPWVMLTDIIKLRKLSPWNIEVDHIIHGFLEKMLSMDLINFRISGLALFSASLLHRLKTETVLKSNQEEEVEDDIEEEFKLLPPIVPPFRQTSRRVSIGELLVALDDVLKQEKIVKERSLISKSLINELKPLVFAIDPDRTQIENIITRIYEKIKEKSLLNRKVKFREILTDKSKIGIVRTFFCVLILGFRGYIEVWQEEDFGEIFIELLLDEGEISLGDIYENNFP
jgi:segregation and condensation protein A